uniref:Uncharacterized protein n=1 Tax=Romanomermis culicivorax TaxID=13658 RepID=A0A915K7T3_ROMCU
MVPLNPTDLVHKSADGVYHATCFICIFCGHLLQPGDEYVVHDGFLVCRLDYEAMVQGAFGPAYKLPSSSNHSDHHRKSPKRPRTILTSQQRKAFKASFELSAKPCRKVREALAKETGLSVRVVQVW